MVVRLVVWCLPLSVLVVATALMAVRHVLGRGCRLGRRVGPLGGHACVAGPVWDQDMDLECHRLGVDHRGPAHSRGLVDTRDRPQAGSTEEDALPSQLNSPSSPGTFASLATSGCKV